MAIPMGTKTALPTPSMANPPLPCTAPQEEVGTVIAPPTAPLTMALGSIAVMEADMEAHHLGEVEGIMGATSLMRVMIKNEFLLDLNPFLF